MKPITDVHELFRYQRAIRTFTDAEVPDALVDQVLTAAIHGPSGSNTQPWQSLRLGRRCHRGSPASHDPVGRAKL